MIGNIALPPELITSLGAETPDFAVESARKEPVKKSLLLIVMGIGLFFLGSLVLLAFLTPALTGTESSIEINDVPTKVGPGNWTPIFIPVAILSFFVLISIYMFIAGIVNLFSKGGYFVGTPTHLLNFRKGNLETVAWEQFSGTTKINKNNLSLEKKTGSVTVRTGGRNAPDRVIPDVVYMVNIPNVYEIEAICVQRIKENDPTPPQPVL